MNMDKLRFPSGRSVDQARQDAKTLSREAGIPLAQALDQVCSKNGMHQPWNSALASLKASANAVVCVCCSEPQSDRTNPLMVVSADFDDGGQELVHLHCAKNDSRYGCCWCCRDERIFLAVDLNDADECPDHRGESVSDSLEEDIDSYIENVRNNS